VPNSNDLSSQSNVAKISKSISFALSWSTLSIIISEPSLENLVNAISSEDLKKEFISLVKELGGEAGYPDFYKGNYDKLTPEQRRYNEILQIAKKEYYGVGEEGYGQ